MLRFLSRALTSGLSSVLALSLSVAFSLALTLSGTFAATVSGFLGSMGVRTAYAAVTAQRDTARRGLTSARTENRRLQKRLTSNRQLVQRVNRRVFTRTLRSTARSVAAIGIEAMPVIGVAALVGTTAWEIHDGCANLNDLHELYTAFDLAPEYPEYQQTCIAYAAKVDGLKTQAESLRSWIEDQGFKGTEPGPRDIP